MKINRYTKYIVLMALILLTVFPAILHAQTFDEARTYAFNGQREKARSICRAILAQGFNSDVALLMGRTYAWDGKYDSARVVLKNVLLEKPGNMEAYDALSDVEFWSDNSQKAIEYCNEAIQHDLSEYSFVLKKARILYSEEDYEAAVDVLENYLEKNPGQPEFLLKLKDYRLDLMKNKIKLIYTYDYFSKDFNRDPWHLLAFSYGRKTKLGSVIFRVNFASRFGIQGLQYELDAYPSLGENSYGYLNYGISTNKLFPNNRFGAEFYHNFSHAFEGSLGLRLLDFGSSGVDIYTATFGKYVSNYWISLRTYVTPDPSSTSVSAFLSVRRYFADSEDYIGFKAGYGISPDDRRNPVESIESLLLKSYSIKTEYSHIFSRRWIFNTAIAYSSEQPTPGKYSGYVTVDVGISWLF